MNLSAKFMIPDICSASSRLGTFAHSALSHTAKRAHFSHIWLHFQSKPMLFRLSNKYLEPEPRYYHVRWAMSMHSILHLVLTSFLCECCSKIECKYRIGSDFVQTVFLLSARLAKVPPDRIDTWIDVNWYLLHAHVFVMIINIMILE